VGENVNDEVAAASNARRSDEGEGKELLRRRERRADGNDEVEDVEDEDSSWDDE